MTGRQGLLLGWPTLVTGGLVLVLLGGAGTYIVMHRPQSSQTAGAVQQQIAMPPRPSSAAPGTPLADVVVRLSREAVERAGIIVTPVAAGRITAVRRFPAVVQPNAYKRVTVTPLVSGRVTRVAADLGQSVTAGSTLAELFSPELTDAETRYVSIRAELDAHERELARTGQLVEIGAASRQELERLHAEHSAKLSELETARSRLTLLGLTAGAITKLAQGSALDSTTLVQAPVGGTVLERMANAGLNVEPSTPLFTIADLSTVWVLADVYEQDFSYLRQGEPATVTFAALPEPLAGTVSYIDPQVDAQTRTAKVRVEVPNRRGDLRIGMIGNVDVTISRAPAATTIPRAAVQHVGDRTLVYLATANQPGTFVEREVRLGDADGEGTIAVLAGLAPGDSVVRDGSFALRAESERLGLRTGVSNSATSQSAATIVKASAKVLVTQQGYEPSTVRLPAGAQAQVTFVRTTDQTCGTEITFPALNIRRPLPLNQSVTIDITVPSSGSVGFQCGMNMLKGSVVAQ